MPIAALYLFAATMLMVYVPWQGSGYSWLWNGGRRSIDVAALIAGHLAVILCLAFVTVMAIWFQTLPRPPVSAILANCRNWFSFPRKTTLAIFAVYFLGASLIAVYVPSQTYVLVGEQITPRVQYSWLWKSQSVAPPALANGFQLDVPQPAAKGTAPRGQPKDPWVAIGAIADEKPKLAASSAPDPGKGVVPKQPDAVDISQADIVCPVKWDDETSKRDIFDDVADELISRPPVLDYRRIGLEELAYGLFMGFVYLGIVLLSIVRHASQRT